jgi:hypothetical protein
MVFVSGLTATNGVGATPAAGGGKLGREIVVRTVLVAPSITATEGGWPSLVA